MKFITIIFLVLFALLTGCNQEKLTANEKPPTFETIRQTKILRVGYIVYPPIVTKNPNTQELGGHFVLSITEIAKQAGWNLEFIETDWSNFSAGLNSKRFDISIAPTFTTIPRLTSVAFTKPLLFAGNSAIARLDDSRFSTIDDLNSPNITIAVTQGEAGHEFAKTHLTQAQLIVHPGSDQSLTFQDVLAGRADVALGDAYVTSKFALQHQEKIRDIFGEKPYNLTPVSWAVRYGDNQLLSFLNNAISVLEIHGKLREYEKQAGANWLHIKSEWTLDYNR